jgi:hypothetical protein
VNDRTAVLDPEMEPEQAEGFAERRGARHQHPYEPHGFQGGPGAHDKAEMRAIGSGDWSAPLQPDRLIADD